jgi:hypothetical protein
MNTYCSLSTDDAPSSCIHDCGGCSVARCGGEVVGEDLDSVPKLNG